MNEWIISAKTEPVNKIYNREENILFQELNKREKIKIRYLQKYNIENNSQFHRNESAISTRKNSYGPSFKALIN